MHPFLNGMIGVEGFNLGTVGMNGPLWSLSHEFWFYVCAGLAAHGYYNRSLAGCLGLALVLAWQALTSNVGWLVGLAIWCGGAALAFMGRTAPRGVTWAMLGVGTAAMITLMAQAQGPMQHAHRMWLGSASILLVAAGLSLTREARPLPSFAKSGADYSFTLYAIHWPLVQLATGFIGKSMPAWPVTARVAVILLLFGAINLVAFGTAIVTEDTPRWRRLARKALGVQSQG